MYQENERGNIAFGFSCWCTRICEILSEIVSEAQSMIRVHGNIGSGREFRRSRSSSFLVFAILEIGASLKNNVSPSCSDI